MPRGLKTMPAGTVSCVRVETPADDVPDRPDGDVMFGRLVDQHQRRRPATASRPGAASVLIRSGEAARTTVPATLDRALAHDPDLLIASLHWGPNTVETAPEPFREFARWLLDRGVDVVHGHSAHVFQGTEVYRGRPIRYDTGDFVDDYAVDPDLRNDRSFPFGVATSAAGEPVELRLRSTGVDGCSIRRARSDATAWSRDRMRALGPVRDVVRAGRTGARGRSRRVSVGRSAPPRNVLLARRPRSHLP
jgi:hypothetical protein